MRRKGGGCRGDDLHEDLVNLVRSQLAPVLRKRYPRLRCICDDWLMMTALGQEVRQGRAGGTIPDALLLVPDSLPLVIEVGRYDSEDRWPLFPVLNVRKNGQVVFLPTAAQPVDRAFCLSAQRELTHLTVEVESPATWGRNVPPSVLYADEIAAMGQLTDG